jgi:methionyl-tRNA synthetase
LSQVLFDVAEAVRVAAVLLLPVMPRSAKEILRRVGETKQAGHVRLSDADWRDTDERLIEKGEALWPRAVTAPADSVAVTDGPLQAGLGRSTVSTTDRSQKVEESRNQHLAGAAPPEVPPSPAPAAASADSRISIDDFMKVELRTAKVLSAEKVPNSRKLVKMSIDVGTEQRTLVAGIAEAYEPETLVGRTIVMVFNLKPAKLMGIESNGMVLAASPDGGKPTLLGLDADVPPGTRVR